MAESSTATTRNFQGAGSQAASTAKREFTFVCCLLALAGCATNPNSDVLVDPLKQRLIAREDIALQNLLLERMPVYAAYDSDAGPRYDGPAVEPPLPDLNLLPEDMPPWEELPPIPVPESSPTVETPPSEPATTEPAAE